MNAILERIGFGSADEARKAALRIAQRKGASGRRGLPGEMVEMMYREYLRVGSLAKAGRIFERTSQSMYELFAHRGFKLRARNFLGRIEYGGKVYTPGKNGYYRCTTGEREPLHHRMWQDRTGRGIPEGWQVSFRDGDCANFAASNLFCAPIADVTLAHYARQFPDRARMSASERAAFWRRHYSERYRRRAPAFKKRGLRCDGKPLAATLKKRLGGNAAWRALKDV